MKIYNSTIIHQILLTIDTDSYLHRIFYNKTANRKYNIRLLLNCIIFILHSGISYKAFTIMLLIIDTNIKFPYYTTIYKFLNKLIKYNVIKITYDRLLKNYSIKNTTYKYFINEALITNKLGIDKKGFNPQLLKHQSSKISLITDSNGIPINVALYGGNVHDSKIMLQQLDSLIKTKSIKQNNKNTFIGDAAYDSNNIREKIAELNLGSLLTVRNKRNAKNKEILNNYKLNKYQKKLVKNNL